MENLTTPRLTIRSFVADDLHAVVALQDACFGPAPREERRAWLERTITNEAQLAVLCQPPYGDRAVVLRDSVASVEHVIGSVGLVPSFGPFEVLPWFRARLDPAQSSPTNSPSAFTTEMGLFWAIAPSYRQHGYATEAAAALAHHAFTTMNVHRLVATTEQDNHASIGVMKKLGMTVEHYEHADPAWFQTVGILEQARQSVRD